MQVDRCKNPSSYKLKISEFYSLYISHTSIETKCCEFLGGPVVRIPCLCCRGHRFDPWSGNQDPASHVVGQEENKTGYPRLLCCAQSLSPCSNLWDPINNSPSGSSTHGDAPGKNPGVGCHALLQDNLPNPGSLALQADSLPAELPEKPYPGVNMAI